MVTMRFVKAILILMLAFSPLAGWSAEPAAEAGKTAAAQEEHGVSPSATDVASIGDFHISNSMIVTWIVALGLIIFAQIATRNIQQVPSGAQNFWEWLVEEPARIFSKASSAMRCGSEDLLVLCHDLHLHRFLKLGGIDSGCWHHRLGRANRLTDSMSKNRCSAAAMPT